MLSLVESCKSLEMELTVGLKSRNKTTITAVNNRNETLHIVLLSLFEIKVFMYHLYMNKKTRGCLLHLFLQQT